MIRCCNECRQDLEKSFAFLPAWWEDPYIDSNGYFGYQDDLDDNGQIVGIRK